MYPSYDMNPIAIEQMRRERLAADMARVDRFKGMRLPVGAVAVIVLALLIFA